MLWHISINSQRQQFIYLFNTPAPPIDGEIKIAEKVSKEEIKEFKKISIIAIGIKTTAGVV